MKEQLNLCISGVIKGIRQKRAGLPVRNKLNVFSGEYVWN